MDFTEVGVVCALGARFQLRKPGDADGLRKLLAEKEEGDDAEEGGERTYARAKTGGT